MDNPALERVGIIGWGLVGSAIGKRLIESGVSVLGYDIDPVRRADLAAAGGVPCDSLRAVAQGAAFLVVALFSSDQVVQALTGPDGVLGFGGHTIVDVTTADPADSVHLATALAAAGLSYLDAPLSGSSDDIRRGNGVFLVGGARDAYQHCADLFARVAGQALYVGDSGSGSRAKLATNLVLGLNRAALAEGLVFAESLGIDASRFLSIVRQTAAYSRAVDSKGEKLVHRDFSPHSRVSQHRKDLDVITRYAALAGVELPLGAVHRQLLIEAEGAGWGDLDTAAVLRAIEARRGTPGD